MVTAQRRGAREPRELVAVQLSDRPRHSGDAREYRSEVTSPNGGSAAVTVFVIPRREGQRPPSAVSWQKRYKLVVSYSPPIEAALFHGRAAYSFASTAPVKSVNCFSATSTSPVLNALCNRYSPVA